LLNDLRGREAIVLAEIEGKEAPRVMIIFGTAESFQMARENSYPGNLVKMLNGKNITDGLNLGQNQAPYITFSIEQVIEFNPQVILRISHGNPQEVNKIFNQEFSSNPVWQSIDAVKNDRVYDLSNDLFFANPGLKIIDALEELAGYLYH
jgi:iron complex transport system substrate-binding protein